MADSRDEMSSEATVAAGPASGGNLSPATAHADDSTSRSTPSHTMASSSFQAINRPSSVDRNEDRYSADRIAVAPISSTNTDVSAPQRARSAAIGTPSAAPRSTSQPDSLDGTSAEAGTYGTRSRNRTGNARPNYSEDQEYDYDFVSSAATTTAAKKAQPAAPTTNGAGGSNAKASKEPIQPTAVNGTAAQPGTANTNAKDAISGAANTTANPKKRKAGGPTAGLSAATAATAPSAAAVRKATAASAASTRETNMMSFLKSKSCLNKKGELVADDGTKLSVNDHAYLVCEPPGDPYYLCRIMEFLHIKSDDRTSPVDSVRVNWYYRPRDVQRFNNDTRLVYSTMHSDLCPLTSLRGRCTIKHRSEIGDLELYRKERDSFYFVQVFDRFIRRWYECIPTSQIINVPEKVKKALDERWKFVAVEIGRVKELTSAVKTCKRCARYCASNDSVDCAICRNAYHMNCVQPPLPKKPSRGFAWACGPCSRASERKKEARHTPTVSGDVTDAEEEVLEEEEQPAPSHDSTRAPSPSESDMPVDDHPATQAEIALAKMWPMRYLGIHCRVEDALQYDDRAIYPRASSRLGPRHQANVNIWHGRPVELVKPADIKKRFIKGGPNQKKEGKLSKETIAALEADRVDKAKRPKWVQDEPSGYVPRGEDYPNDDPRNTAKLLFRMPPPGEYSERGLEAAPERPANYEQAVTDYVGHAKSLARKVGVPPFGTNFLDKAVELFVACNYNEEQALNRLVKVDRVKDLHEPVLSKSDLAKFEEGVAKYGSEHRLIRLHMKTTVSHADVVRFYYLWKKTPKGKEIWGNFPGRKGKKRLENDAAARLHDEVAHDIDDSAFENDKATRHKRGFQCKFCNTVHSRQWRRAPGAATGQTILSDARTGNKDKKERLLIALCIRCANLWRKYAIQWEDIDEVSKKVAAGGGRAWKRRIDEELLRELVAANDAAPTPEPQVADGLSEPLKKKSKTDSVPPSELPKKKEKPAPPPKLPTPPPPPIIPVQPLWRALPCAVCHTGGETVGCASCKLTVHRSCYGLNDKEGLKANGEAQWMCDQCQNDRNPMVSTEYSCCLCLTEMTEIDLVEPPRVTHKKKSERDREKERLEKELADEMRADYRSKQLAHNRPPAPREPLKTTAGNNWVHVYCAVWTPEIRFSNAKALEVAEGLQSIPPARHEAVCKLCKNKDHQNKIRSDKGACVTCFQCQTPFHASCAFEAGYQFGFDVTPVKGSRKDQITTATLGPETGSLTAAIWCKEHVVKTIIHPMHEIADDTGRTALEVFVENYKQADLTLTGTVRKAQLAQLTKDKGQQAAQPVQVNPRRESGAHSIAAAVRRGARTSIASEMKQEDGDGAVEDSDRRDVSAPPFERRCVQCNIDVTPKWHAVAKGAAGGASKSPRPARRRLSMTLGEMTDRDGERPIEQGLRPAAGVDITGAPAMNRQSDPSRSQQHNRHVPTGANGRAWDGTHDRPGPAPTMNGDSRVTEPMQIDSVVAPTTETAPPQVNGDASHRQARPRNEGKKAKRSAIQSADPDYVCHKCFLKKKLDPTPPPPEHPARVEFSPPRQFPIRLEWNGAPPPPPQAPPSQLPLPRSPWQEPTRPSQAPPPPPPPPSTTQPPAMNGYALPSGFVTQSGPPPGFPQAYHQPSGYHGVQPGLPQAPPGLQAPTGPPPPSMHDSRASGFGYGSQPPSKPPGYPIHSPSRPPPPLSVFPAAATQPLSNGIGSPHAPQHPPLHSPTTYPPPPPPPPPPSSHHQYPPRRTESPFSTQLPSLGPPANSNPSPSVPQHAQPGAAQQQQQQQQQHQQSQHQPNRATPAPTPGPGGASASPNLRNLLS